MLSRQDAPAEPERNDPDPPREVGGAGAVGQSITRRGEDVAGDKEPGREYTGTDDTFGQRPHGTSHGAGSHWRQPTGADRGHFHRVRRRSVAALATPEGAR
jgi:hypothetical protein